MALFVPGASSGGSSTTSAGGSIWTNGTDFWSYTDDGTTKTWEKLTGAGAGTSVTTAPTDAVPVAGNAQRETVSTRFTAITTSAGFWTIGDTIQRVIVYDISASLRSVLLVAWFNETTNTALTATTPAVGTDVVEKESSGGGDLVLYTIGGTTWLPGRRTWVGEDATLRSVATGAEVTTATGVASFIERTAVKYTTDAGATILDGFEVVGIRDGQTTTSRLYVTDGDGTVVATPTVVSVEDYVGYPTATPTVPVALQRITDTATGTVTFRNTQTRAAVLVASLDRYVPGVLEDGTVTSTEVVHFSLDFGATWFRGFRVKRSQTVGGVTSVIIDEVYNATSGALVAPLSITTIATDVEMRPVSYTTDSGVTILTGSQAFGYVAGGATKSPLFVADAAGTVVATPDVVTVAPFVGYLTAAPTVAVAVDQITTAAGVVTYREGVARTLRAIGDFDRIFPGYVSGDLFGDAEPVLYSTDAQATWSQGTRRRLLNTATAPDQLDTVIYGNDGVLVTAPVTDVAINVTTTPVDYTTDGGVTILSGDQYTGFLNGGTTAVPMFVTTPAGIAVGGAVVVGVEQYVGYLPDVPKHPFSVDKITTSAGAITYRDSKNRTLRVFGDFERLHPGTVDGTEVLEREEVAFEDGAGGYIPGYAVWTPNLDGTLTANYFNIDGTVHTPAALVATNLQRTVGVYSDDGGATTRTGYLVSGFIDDVAPLFLYASPFVGGAIAPSAVPVQIEDWVGYLSADPTTPIPIRRFEIANGLVVFRDQDGVQLTIGINLDRAHPGVIVASAGEPVAEPVWYSTDSAVTWFAGTRRQSFNTATNALVATIFDSAGAAVTGVTNVATDVQRESVLYTLNSGGTIHEGWQYLGYVDGSNVASTVALTNVAGSTVLGYQIVSVEEWVVFLTADPDTPVAFEAVTNRDTGVVTWINKVTRATVSSALFDRRFPGQIGAAETKAVEFFQTSHVVSELAAADVKAANTKRQYIFIRNDGGSLIWLRFDNVTATTAAPAYPLNPGEYYETWPGLAPRARVSAIADTTAGSLFIIES